MFLFWSTKFCDRWSLIAENLPGRTDNEVKNYWHSNLRKFLKSKVADQCTESERTTTETTSEVVSVDSHHILESSNLSMSSSEVSCAKDNSSCYVESNVNLYREVESTVASWETLDGFSSNFWTEPFILENALSQDYFPISCYEAEAEDPFLLW